MHRPPPSVPAGPPGRALLNPRDGHQDSMVSPRVREGPEPGSLPLLQDHTHS